MSNVIVLGHAGGRTYTTAPIRGVAIANGQPGLMDPRAHLVTEHPTVTSNPKSWLYMGRYLRKSTAPTDFHAPVEILQYRLFEPNALVEGDIWSAYDTHPHYQHVP